MSRDKPTRRPILPTPPRADDLGSDDHDPNEPAHDATGAVKFDERGNAVWQWSIETGSFGVNASAERMRRLDNPKLSIADDQPTPYDSVKSNPLGLKKGYNPYDSGKLDKNGQPRKKTDLRKLSEWLKLKKLASSNKDDEE